MAELIEAVTASNLFDDDDLILFTDLRCRYVHLPALHLIHERGQLAGKRNQRRCDAATKQADPDT